jgi:hypothetical protein
MDAGLTVRSTASPASHAPSPARQTVSTDLASSQTVTAAASAANIRNDNGQAHYDHSHMPVVILDPQSREIIDRSVNAPSRRVVRQIPEPAVRRLKAYTRPGKQQASPQDQHADIEV